MEAEKPKGTGMKRTHLIAAVVAAVVIITGAAYITMSGALSPTVAAGDNVSVYYTGTFTNGTVFGTNVGGQPLNFTVGSDEMISGFSNGVVGMKLNQNKTITLPPQEAYGYVNQSLFVQVPISDFGNSSVQLGGDVVASNGQQGVITALNNTTVTVDLNPPLAGDTLVFQVKVVSIKK